MTALALFGAFFLWMVWAQAQTQDPSSAQEPPSAEDARRPFIGQQIEAPRAEDRALGPTRRTDLLPPLANCNIEACAARHQSFRAADCTHQPFFGPRRYCEITVQPGPAPDAWFASDPRSWLRRRIAEPPRQAPPPLALLPSPERCDYPQCGGRYTTFRSADCSFQPFEGPRRYCRAGAFEPPRPATGWFERSRPVGAPRSSFEDLLERDVAASTASSATTTQDGTGAASPQLLRAPLQCNQSACAARYSTFRAADCSFQPFEGPRRYCVIAPFAPPPPENVSWFDRRAPLASPITSPDASRIISALPSVSDVDALSSLSLARPDLVAWAAALAMAPSPDDLQSAPAAASSDVVSQPTIVTPPVTSRSDAPRAADPPKTAEPPRIPEPPRTAAPPPDPPKPPPPPIKVSGLVALLGLVGVCLVSAGLSALVLRSRRLGLRAEAFSFTARSDLGRQKISKRPHRRMVRGIAALDEPIAAGAPFPVPGDLIGDPSLETAVKMPKQENAS